MTNYAEVQTALAAVWSDLPGMLGEQMDEFERKLLPMLRQLEKAPNDKKCVDDVLGMIEDEYPKVYECMVEASAVPERKADPFEAVTPKVPPRRVRYEDPGPAREADPAAAPDPVSAPEQLPASAPEPLPEPAPEQLPASAPEPLPEPAPVPRPAPELNVLFRSTANAVPAPVGRYMIVPVWYATDRKNTGAKSPEDRYSGERGTLVYGRLEVSIPDSHKKGQLEKPSIFRLEFRANPEKHVILMSVEECSLDAWKAELKQKVTACPKKEVLLFIHGYNVGFEDAARRAAQFAYDLEFQGTAVLYSWPSEGKTALYTVDEDNALWTVDDFEEVLATLMKDIGAECIHAVAHSMGNRVLTEGLRRLDTAALPTDAAKLREVVFAAPDINADTFRKFVEKFHARAGRFTLYASSGDKALEASQKVHKYPRAGDSGDGIVVLAGLDSIDASAVDTSFLGHSYFGDSRTVIEDLFSLLVDGKPPEKRFGMRPRKSAAGSYWAFVP